MKKFLLFLSLISIVHWSNAQCGYRGQYQGVVTPGCGSFGSNAPTAATGFRLFSQVNGVNYSVQTCGSGWDTQLSAYNVSNAYAGYYNDDSYCGLQSEYTWTANYSGIIKWQVDRYNCSPSGSWPTTSAVLQVRQNTTVTNTTSTAPICESQTKNLTYSLGGGGSATPTWSIVAGGGSISGNTYTPANFSSNTTVTVRAILGVCQSDVTFLVNAQPTYVGSTASMCVGENRTLTSNVGGTVFSGPGVSGNTFTAPDPGGVSGNYTITLTNGSCSSIQVITVYARPTITSSSTDMCEGDTRTLTASLSGGVWSGTGVSGNTFTAPTPSGASQIYTVTYTTLGSACPSVTQDITVYANPFAANAGEDKPACINNPATLSASNPPIGSGTWTWSPSAPVYAGGTTANDYNAEVTFSAAGSYRGIWTVTSGPCASTSSDTMYVNVSAANNNASLFSSAGAAAESVQAFEVCEEGAWTYYAAPGSSDEYLFAINKHGSSFSAYVDIVDLPGTQTIESLGGSPAIRGTWLIGRYWNATIQSGSITTPVDVRFFVDPAEVTQAENEATAFLNNTAAATNMTALTFFKTVSNTFDPATSLVNGEFTFAPAYLPYTTGTLNGVTYYELTGLTSFSGGTGGFSVNDSGSPLPVELLEFNVNTVDNQFIRLDWATASEINNDGFEVLRSTDGVNFERIAWIGGNGNSTEINEYVFNDRGVDKGMTYYYQLKQIDYDGQYEYFDIKSARLDGKTTFTVGALVPNPSKGSEIVSVDIQTVSGDVLTVEIYDRIGSKVKSASYVLFAADNALDINISDLAAGTYFLKFDSSMGTETKKLVVVK
jgi:hypothetical protein